MSIPAIAIHSSQARGKLARTVRANFEGSSGYDGVDPVEFDWGRTVPSPSHRGLRNLCRFLLEHAANISAASRLGLDFGTQYVDRRLGALQSRLHRILEAIVAVALATACAMFVAEVVLLAPAGWYGLSALTFAPMDWMSLVLGWLKLGFAAGVTMLMGLGGIRVILTMTPRPGVVTFRSIGMLFLRPALIVATAALVADWWVAGGVFAALSLHSFAVTGVAGAVLWSVAFGLLVGVRVFWRRQPRRGPIKPLLDMFRYLGEPSYRQRVQQALDETIEQARRRAGPCEDCVLVAEGFGAVIAVDSIMHSHVWQRSDRVLLVTMGSPLRRYLMRFYPRTLFPDYMENVVNVMTGRLNELRWMNIYRPLDYLGTSLGLAEHNGRDVTTGPRRLSPDAHADYWLDMETRRAFRYNLPLLQPVQAPGGASMKEAAHGIPKPARPTALRMPSAARLALKITFSIATFGWMLWWVSRGIGIVTPNVGASLQSVDRAVVVDATVTHHRESLRHSRGSNYVDHWAFEFIDANGTRQSLSVTRNAQDAFLDVPHRYDNRALMQHVRSACRDPEKADWLRARSNLETPCTVENVRLRYYPGNVSYFDLPGFPLQRVNTTSGRVWTEVGLVAAVLSVLAVVPITLGAGAFVLFL